MLIEANELIRLYKDKKWRKNIVILDASWYLPTVKREPFKEFKNTHLPDALYFDIDEVNSNLCVNTHKIGKCKSSYNFKELIDKNEALFNNEELKNKLKCEWAKNCQVAWDGIDRLC